MPVKRQHVESRGKPHRGPVYLSALVYPGAGQFMQKRWAAGLFYAFAFTVCMVGFFAFTGWILVAYYALGIHFDTYQERELPGMAALLFFLATLLIYFLNLFDAYRGFRRAGSAWAGDRLRQRSGHSPQDLEF